MNKEQARAIIELDRKKNPAAYAAEENKITCIRCGRPLSDPESVAAGIGPECSAKAKQEGDPDDWIQGERNAND